MNQPVQVVAIQGVVLPLQRREKRRRLSQHTFQGKTPFCVIPSLRELRLLQSLQSTIGCLNYTAMGRLRFR